jgi:hypothetical protein
MELMTYIEALEVENNILATGMGQHFKSAHS